MHATFNFSQTNPAGAGVNLPDGWFRFQILKVEDVVDTSPAKARISFAVDPSEGLSGVVVKTFRYPNGDPKDGGLAFWMSLFLHSGVATLEMMKSGEAQLDPGQQLPNRIVHAHFIPADKANGRDYYDLEFCSEADYQAQKALAMARGANGAAKAAGAGAQQAAGATGGFGGQQQQAAAGAGFGGQQQQAAGGFGGQQGGFGGQQTQQTQGGFTPPAQQANGQAGGGWSQMFKQ